MNLIDQDTHLLVQALYHYVMAWW